MATLGTFGFQSTAEEVTAGIDLRGKTMLVTGCNSGIGLETLRVLALRGAHVIGAARTEEKAKEAFAQTGVSGTAVECELSEPSSVRACVKKLSAIDRSIDVIVANAGIMALPELTVRYGVELQFLTNHLGHFLLVTGLERKLSANARVVMVSSGAHFRAPKSGVALDDLAFSSGYSPWRAYGQSKLANILFARQLASRWRSTQRTANALHPGVIRTNLTRYCGEGAFGGFDPSSMKTVAQGAATQCLLATHPELSGLSGTYFSDCQEATPSAQALDDEQARLLWNRSEELAATLP